VCIHYIIKLTHSDLNPRFNIYVVFMTNYFLVGGDVSVDSETLLMTDFVNLKIKLTQFFKGTHRGSVCMRVFIG
jgi:hypothetical protein